MKTNVVWLHSHFLYWMGGTKFVHEVNKNLAQQKKITSLVTIVENKSKLVTKNYQKSKLKLISLDSITSNNALYWILFPFFLIRNTFRLKNYLQSQDLNKNNTVLVSSMFPMNVMATLLGYKHVQMCYEPFAFFYDVEFTQKFSLIKQVFISTLKLFYSPLDKWGTRKASQVLTLNSVTRQLIKDTYQVKSKLTQAGVNSTYFKPGVSQKIKKKYQGKKIIIHSTDYSPVKGTDKIIKIMAEVIKQVPKTVLLITSTIDNPTVKAELKNLAKSLKISKQVVFLGFVSIEDLPKYYSLATLLVQGSSSAKSGTTSMALPVKEAMACETPAIRPKVGAEDVQDKITGFIVDPNNAQKMIKTIIFALTHPKEIKVMGKKARKFIQDNYTWKKTSEVIIKAIVSQK